MLNHCCRVEVVATAKNGQEAIELTGIHRPEFVLMDLRMPGMNGFEAAAQITKKFPSTRVVHITTDQGPEIEKASRKSGAERLVRKDRLASRFCDVFVELFGACETRLSV